MKTKIKIDWSKPQEVDAVTSAFGGDMGRLLPPMHEIPEEYQKHRSEWCDIAMRLFFNGGQLPQVKEGIDAAQAKRHLTAVLTSFEPKHEHKEAAAGWLMSQWYVKPEKK